MAPRTGTAMVVHAAPLDGWMDDLAQGRADGRVMTDELCEEEERVFTSGMHAQEEQFVLCSFGSVPHAVEINVRCAPS